MNDNDGLVEVYVNLCFKGFSVPSSSIDDLLGLTATEKYDAGDTIKSGRIARFSFWCIELGIFNVEMLDEAIYKSLCKIESKKQKIFLFSKESSSESSYLNAAFSIGTRYPSAYFDRDLIMKLSEVGLSLSLDCIGNRFAAV